MKFRGKSGSKKSASGVIVGGSGGRFTKKQLIIAAILLLIASSYSFYVFRQKTHISKNPPVCSEETITNASNLLYPSDKGQFKKLPTVISKIRNTENYQNDVNCMYPIMVYAVFSGIDDNTSKDLENFNKVADYPLSEIYGYRMDAGNIKEAIDALINKEQEAADNAVLFN